MTWANRLENAYVLLLGAAMAFFFCHYVWQVEGAMDAAMLLNLAWVICFFSSRHLRNQETAARG